MRPNLSCIPDNESNKVAIDLANYCEKLLMD